MQRKSYQSYPVWWWWWWSWQRRCQWSLSELWYAKSNHAATYAGR